MGVHQGPETSRWRVVRLPTRGHVEFRIASQVPSPHSQSAKWTFVWKRRECEGHARRLQNQSPIQNGTCTRQPPCSFKLCWGCVAGNWSLFEREFVTMSKEYTLNNCIFARINSIPWYISKQLVFVLRDTLWSFEGFRFRWGTAFLGVFWRWSSCSY